MNGTEKDNAGLQAEVAGLRTALNLAVLLLFGVSLLLNALIYREIRSARNNAQVFPANLGAVVENYQKTDLPRAQQLAADLNEYGKTHPEIAPLLKKYSLLQVVAAANAGPASLPESPK